MAGIINAVRQTTDDPTVDENGNPIDPNAPTDVTKLSTAPTVPGAALPAAPNPDATTPSSGTGNPLAPGNSATPSGNSVPTGAANDPNATDTSTLTDAPPMDTGGGNLGPALSGSLTSSTTTAAPAPSDTASWTPTSGIVDQIRGITPQNVTATGYDATAVGDTPQATAEGYGATGYTAQQGTAATADENLSQATSRIMAADSPILQRARALADEQSNSRGLLNSSIAAGAGTAATIDAATTLGQGDVAAAQFNAQQQNVMTINNVQQANDALKFHADAQNQAAAFAAQARNSVSQFNSQAAQQKAEFAAQQWDAAKAFSAQAQNAASSQNAQAYNDAMQKYVDAKNAATAAQNDAENLARRDTAQIAAQQQLAATQARATVQSAAIHAGAMETSARIGAQASEANTQANITAQETMQRAGLTQQQQQFAQTLGATQFANFTSQLNSIMTADLEPDARTNAIHNLMSVWQAGGTLPFNIDVSQFPAAAGTGAP